LESRLDLRIDSLKLRTSSLRTNLIHIRRNFAFADNLDPSQVTQNLLVDWVHGSRKAFKDYQSKIVVASIEEVKDREKRIFLILGLSLL
jgi:hypothetical protein